MRQETTTTNTPSNPGLLDLPGELRNLIYDLVVEETTCDFVSNFYDSRISIPELALVCKQIFREVVSVQSTRDNSTFRWRSHDSGGDLDSPLSRALCSQLILNAGQKDAPCWVRPSVSDIFGSTHHLVVVLNRQPRVEHGVFM